MIKRKVFEMANPSTELQLELALQGSINDINENHTQAIFNAFSGFLVSFLTLVIFEKFTAQLETL